MYRGQTEGSSPHERQAVSEPEKRRGDDCMSSVFVSGQSEARQHLYSNAALLALQKAYMDTLHRRLRYHVPLVVQNHTSVPASPVEAGRVMRRSMIGAYGFSPYAVIVYGSNKLDPMLILVFMLDTASG